MKMAFYSGFDRDGYTGEKCWTCGIKLTYRHKYSFFCSEECLKKHEESDDFDAIADAGW